MGFSSRRVLAAAEEALRREAERSERLSSVMLAYSLDGGTGAGAGSALLEWCRDAFPKAALVTVAVLGRHATPLAPYNAALAAAHAQHLADCILLRQQCETQRTCAQRATRDSLGAPGAVSTRDANRAFGADLAALALPRDAQGELAFLPAFSRKKLVLSHNTLWRSFDAGRDVVSSACPVPALKFVDVRSTLSLPRSERDAPAAAAAARRPAQRAQSGGVVVEWQA